MAQDTNTNTNIYQGQTVLVTAIKPAPNEAHLPLTSAARQDQAYKRIADGKLGFLLPGQARAIARYIEASQGPELWQQDCYYVIEITYEGKRMWKGRMIGKVEQVVGQLETAQV